MIKSLASLSNGHAKRGYNLNLYSRNLLGVNWLQSPMKCLLTATSSKVHTASTSKKSTTAIATHSKRGDANRTVGLEPRPAPWAIAESSRHYYNMYGKWGEGGIRTSLWITTKPCTASTWFKPFTTIHQHCAIQNIKLGIMRRIAPLTNAIYPHQYCKNINYYYGNAHAREMAESKQLNANNYLYFTWTFFININNVHFNAWGFY